MAILRQPLQHSRQLLRNSIRNSKQLTRHPQQRTLMGLTQKEILYAKSMPPKEIGQQLIMHCGIGVARTAAALLGSDKQPLKLLAWGTKKFPKIWKDIYYAGETATEASVAAKPFRNLGVGAYFQDAREASETKAEIETAIKETMLTISVAEPGDWISIKPTAFILKENLMAFDITKPIPLDHEDLQALIELGEIANEKGLKISFDAEGKEIQPYINAVCETLQQVLNKIRAVIFNTYQMQLGNDPLDSLLERANKDGFKAGIKCVNGAYREDYQFSNVKEAVNAYASRTERLANENGVALEVICCTHNPANTTQAQSFEFPTATLRGMSNNQSVKYAGKDKNGNRQTFIAFFFGNEEKAQLFVERRVTEAIDMDISRVLDGLNFYTAAALIKAREFLAS